MTIPRLIYCAGSNRRYADIALKYGFGYGAQMPGLAYHPPEFIDQDWNAPNRAEYMQKLAAHRPRLATVLDLEHPDQLQTVLSWAREAAEYVSEAVIIIPKYPGLTPKLPRHIREKEVWLGYSVPTSHGNTSVELTEFMGWPVHILGGSPQTQLRLSGQYPTMNQGLFEGVASLNVRTCDGNYIMKMANNNQFFVPGTAIHTKNRHFPQLKEVNLGHIDTDSCYAAFELSCVNFQAALHGCTAGIRYAADEDIPAVKRIASQWRDELGFVNRAALGEAVERRELFVAEDGNYIVGFVHWHRRRDGWYTIYEIAIDKSYLRRGIGQGLLRSVLRPVRLKCTVDNQRANDFYESQGMHIETTESGRKRSLNVWVDMGDTPVQMSMFNLLESVS